MAQKKMGLIGRKVGMTQLFGSDGRVIPVTVIELGPCPVMRVKSSQGADGYDAVQLGFGAQKATRLNKPVLGQYEQAKLAEPVRHVREFRVAADVVGQYETGQTVTVGDLFEEGKVVDVTGTSKGRGFAGVMKRYNFRGFIRSHGSHEFFRHGGSIGTRLTPGMVFKGKKMPGHMGSARVTIQNLTVAKVDAERNLVFVTGGVPGPNGGLVMVRHAAKAAA